MAGAGIPFLRARFPGQKILARLEYDDEPKATSTEVLDDAIKAKAAGFEFTADELSRLTGYSLARGQSAPQAQSWNQGGAVDSPPSPGDSPVTAPGALNRLLNAADGSGEEAQEAREGLGIVRENRPGGDGDENPAPDAQAPENAVLAQIADEASTAVEEALLKAIDEAFADDGSVRVENENPNRAPDGEYTNGGGDQTTGRGRAREPETKSKHDRHGSIDADALATTPKLNMERGASALAEVLRKKSGYVEDAMYRKDVGWIRFDWGDAGDPSKDYVGGHGISHIKAKHPNAFGALTETLAKGDAFKEEGYNTIALVHDNAVAFLGSVSKGRKRVLSGFEPSDPKYAERMRKNPPAFSRPEGGKGG